MTEHKLTDLNDLNINKCDKLAKEIYEIEKLAANLNVILESMQITPIDTSKYEKIAKTFEDLATKQREHHSTLVKLDRMKQPMVKIELTSFLLGVSACVAVACFFSMVNA